VISVVINFLNAEPFLQESIDSVFAQTDARWELLLVDDGSTDASSAIALRCAEQHPSRVRYLEHAGHRNLGTSASRNLGLRAARGEYAICLDADDVLLPTALAEQRALLEAHPRAAMVYGPIEWWRSWTGDPADLGRDRVQSLGVPPDALVEPPELLVRFLRRTAAAPSGMLVRRAAVARVGAYEDDFRALYDDQVFCAKVCLTEPVYAASRCWYRYRRHGGSITATADASRLDEAGRLPFLTWLEGYLASRGVTRGPAWDAVRRELWLVRHPAVHRIVKRARRARRRVWHRWERLVRRLLATAGPADEAR